MRVVLTGISGLGKEDVLAKIRRINGTDDPRHPFSDPDVALNCTGIVDLTFDLEHEMCKNEEIRTPNYLDISENILLNAKNRTIEKLISESEGKENIILGMHTVYYRRSSLFSVLDWKKLKEFKPDMFVTLIDDVHSIKSRIENNANAGPVKYISLKEILWWRDVEFLLTKEIARNISSKNIPHYLVAMSQAPTVIFQLMLEPYKRKVYASYPITTAKEDPTLQSETKDFVSRLKKHFIVFDPIAISEKLLHDALIENLKSPHPEPYLRLKRIGNDSPIAVNEVLQVISDINGQIVSRDHRLIKQCDMVIGYRPTKSPGAQDELKYAKSTGRVETFIVNTKEDSQSPFISELAEEIFPNIDQLFLRLYEKGYITETA